MHIHMFYMQIKEDKQLHVTTP